VARAWRIGIHGQNGRGEDITAAIFREVQEGREPQVRCLNLGLRVDVFYWVGINHEIPEVRASLFLKLIPVEGEAGEVFAEAVGVGEGAGGAADGDDAGELGAVEQVDFGYSASLTLTGKVPAPPPATADKPAPSTPPPSGNGGIKPPGTNSKSEGSGNQQ
jgi:hypothetical protein